MDNRQKWVNLSYVSLGALLAYVVFALLLKVAGQYDLEARVQNIDLVIRVVSVLSGAILFFGLYRNTQANQFANEVVAELAKVTWPTTKETHRATIVVIIMVLISGAILGLFDSFWTWLLKWVL